MKKGRPPKRYAVIMPDGKFGFFTRAELAAIAGVSIRSMQDRQHKTNKYDELIKNARFATPAVPLSSLPHEGSSR